MSMDRAVQELNTGLERLHSQVSNHLLWVILHGRPDPDGQVRSAPEPDSQPTGLADHYLVGRLEDRVTEALDRIEQACLLSNDSLASDLGLAAASAELVRLQESLNNLLMFGLAEMFDHEHIAELREFGSEHGDAWEDWTENVIIEMDRCQAALLDTCQALLPCWQELAERMALSSLYIQTSSAHQPVMQEATGITRRSSLTRRSPQAHRPVPTQE